MNELKVTKPRIRAMRLGGILKPYVIKVPYPIPEPERSKLQAAGILAVAARLKFRACEDDDVDRTRLSREIVDCSATVEIINQKIQQKYAK